MSIFGNKPQGNIFSNTQPQQNMAGSIFGGNQQQPQQQQGVNIFANQQQPQQQQTGNIFGGGQQQPQQTGNIFGGGQQQQPLQNTMFTQQKTGLFNTQQPQQQTTTGNIFGGGQQQQQQQTTNIFGGQQQQQPQQSLTQGTNVFGPQQQQTNLNQLFQTTTSASDSQRIRFQIEQFCRRVDPKNLQHIRIDQMNMFKDHRLNDLPDDLKKPILILVNNMKDLRKIIDNIKKENDELDNKAATYCKNVQQKLFKYKESLIQNIQQTNLIEQVRQQVELINSQVTNFIIPLYNAYRTGRHFTFDSPDEFSSIIAKNILQKMIELNNKLDEIISCQQSNDEDSLSERDSATLLVLEQLLNYYENVSAKVMEFTNHYNAVKRAKIQSMKRTSSYEQIMRRIQQKVNTKMQKDFKSYDLIKQIESILQKREKRQQQLSSDYYRERRSDLLAERGGLGENRWNRF